MLFVFRSMRNNGDVHMTLTALTSFMRRFSKVWNEISDRSKRPYRSPRNVWFRQRGIGRFGSSTCQHRPLESTWWLRASIYRVLDSRWSNSTWPSNSPSHAVLSLSHPLVLLDFPFPSSTHPSPRSSSSSLWSTLRCGHREIFQKVISSDGKFLAPTICRLFRISLVDISRRLLAILNYNTICSNLVNLTVDTEENLARKSNLFHQSILSSVPCSLPLDLLLQQIQVPSRSHRH